MRGFIILFVISTLLSGILGDDNYWTAWYIARQASPDSLFKSVETGDGTPSRPVIFTTNDINYGTIDAIWNIEDVQFGIPWLNRTSSTTQWYIKNKVYVNDRALSFDGTIPIMAAAAGNDPGIIWTITEYLDGSVQMVNNGTQLALTCKGGDPPSGSTPDANNEDQRLVLQRADAWSFESTLTSTASTTATFTSIQFVGNGQTSVETSTSTITQTVTVAPQARRDFKLEPRVGGTYSHLIAGTSTTIIETSSIVLSVVVTTSGVERSTSIVMTTVFTTTTAALASSTVSGASKSGENKNHSELAVKIAVPILAFALLVALGIAFFFFRRQRIRKTSAAPDALPKVGYAPPPHIPDMVEAMPGEHMRVYELEQGRH